VKKLILYLAKVILTLSVDDEAGGPFLVIEQHDDDIENGKVRMDYEEFAAVAEAAKMLMHQMYIEQAGQE
jgi:hypothetical protein